jgi:hypothetical protein
LKLRTWRRTSCCGPDASQLEMLIKLGQGAGAKGVKKIASTVKTHAALHAYPRSVHLPRRRPGAPRNGTETMTAAPIRLFFKAGRRLQ